MTKQELIQQLSETVEQHYSRAHLAVVVGKFELDFFKGVSWIAKLDPLFKLIQLTSVAQDMDTFIPGRVKRDPRHRFIAGVIRRLDNHKVIGAVIAVWNYGKSTLLISQLYGLIDLIVELKLMVEV